MTVYTREQWHKHVYVHYKTMKAVWMDIETLVVWSKFPDDFFIGLLSDTTTDPPQFSVCTQTELMKAFPLYQHLQQFHMTIHHL